MSGYGSLITGTAKFAGPDQGLDFTGRGVVHALAGGIVTRVQRSGSGWDGEGAILAYHVTEPGSPLFGRYLYIAEDFAPTVAAGHPVRKGQVIGVATGSGKAPGIEVGFATGAGGQAYGNPQEGKAGKSPDPEATALQAYLLGGPSAYEALKGVTSKGGGIAGTIAEGLGAGAEGISEAGKAVLNAPGELVSGAAGKLAEEIVGDVVGAVAPEGLKILLYAVLVIGGMVLAGYGLATMISPKPPSLTKAATKAATTAAKVAVA